MSVITLKRNMMNKIINARIDLDAYLQLRKAKGYMSIGDNEHLRRNLFDLCGELRSSVPLLIRSAGPQERDAWRQAGEAIGYAAVCLMSGHHDCPTAITVNVDSLERCLTTLSESIHAMNAHVLYRHPHSSGAASD